MEHAFNTNVATQYSVDTSLILHHLKFWTLKNLSNKKNIFDGHCWSYDTLDALCIQFPFWSKRQIERIINNAVKLGLVIKGNYNKNTYDRTTWYAITPVVYGLYPELLNETLLRTLYLSISPNGEMDYTEWRNGYPQTVTPIPDTDPDTDPNINNIGTSDEALKNEKENVSTSEENKNNNQALEFDEAQKGLEGSNLPTKSDYRKNQTKNESFLSKKAQYDIKDILENNIYQIPEQIIQDWITTRKQKRAPVTQTAWNKINKELAKCQEKGIDPVEAFETMVASGWQSMKVEYFDNQKNLSRKSGVNNSDTSWGDEVFKPFYDLGSHL